MTDEELDEKIHKLDRKETEWLEDFIKVFLSGVKYGRENSDTEQEDDIKYAEVQFLEMTSAIKR